VLKPGGDRVSIIKNAPTIAVEFWLSRKEIHQESKLRDAETACPGSTKEPEPTRQQPLPASRRPFQPRADDARALRLAERYRDHAAERRQGRGEPPPAGGLSHPCGKAGRPLGGASPPLSGESSSASRMTW
jgi:hypothetical protein